MSRIRKASLDPRCSALLAAVLCLLLASCAERDLEDAKAGDAGAVSAAASAPEPPSPVSFQLGEAITSCNIETINGVSADGADVQVNAGQDVIVEGWVLAPGADADPEPEPWMLYLQSPDGELFAVTRIERFPRPDLVGRAAEARTAVAGFRAEFRLPEDADGRAGLFLAPASGSVRPTCAIGRGIVVVRS